MSADIWLVDQKGNQLVVDEDVDAELRSMVPMRQAGRTDSTSFNLTYNLTPMLGAAGMPPWGELVGLSCSEAGPIWYRVAQELQADPDRFRIYNPPNGWGSYEDALEVISALAVACMRFPSAVVAGWL